MTLLIIGLVLWVVAHMFKRLAPSARRGLENRLGEGGSKGLMAVLLVISVVLMVRGYRSAPLDPIYTFADWARYLNNLLMLLAVIVFGAGMSKGVIWTRLRHPMLTGVLIWSVAHLLVNGDSASVLLFGVLGIWALAEMRVINAAEGIWNRPRPGAAKRDLVLVVISLIMYGLIAGVHIWAGYNPFQGG